MWSATILHGSFSGWQLRPAAPNNACSKDGYSSQSFKRKPGCKTCVPSDAYFWGSAHSDGGYKERVEEV